MSITEKFQSFIEWVQSAPTSVNVPVMLGSLVLSVLQPLAIIITISWGVLQIHGYVERQWGRDFLYLNRLLRKRK